MISRRTSVAWMFLVPALAVYLIFILYPLGRGLYLSLTDSVGGPTANFVGLEQYRALADEPGFGNAVRNTLVYAAIVVVAQNALGLSMAKALSTRPKLRRPLSFLLLTPALMSPVMAAFIWTYLYAPDGPFNAVLGALGLENLQHVWLGDSQTALVAVAVVNIWMWSGYAAIIFLTGYMAIPGELMEAAELDGAKSWKRFWKIEWPLLAPALTISVTLSLTGSLRTFEFPLVLTGGGPDGATDVLTLVIYRNVFSGGNFALGVAMSVVLLVIVMALASGTNGLLSRRERNAD